MKRYSQSPRGQAILPKEPGRWECAKSVSKLRGTRISRRKRVFMRNRSAGSRRTRSSRRYKRKRKAAMSTLHALRPLCARLKEEYCHQKTIFSKSSHFSKKVFDIYFGRGRFTVGG
jgi:hypothetical protein